MTTMTTTPIHQDDLALALRISHGLAVLEKRLRARAVDAGIDDVDAVVSEQLHHLARVARTELDALGAKGPWLAGIEAEKGYAALAGSEPSSRPSAEKRRR